MGEHRVEPGDCVVSLAARLGFGVEALLAAQRPGFAEERRGGLELVAGETIQVPERTPLAFELTRGAPNRIVLPTPRVTIGLQPCAPGDAFVPYSRCRYEVQAEGEDEVHGGTTEEDGYLEVRLRADVARATVRVWARDGAPEPTVFAVTFGQVPPLSTPQGVQARLHNLGFPCPFDGELGPETASALEAFQRETGLAVTGEVDDATRSRLAELHDGPP